MIAGIVLACHATLSTRNTRHFDDVSVPVINPLENHLESVGHRHPSAKHRNFAVLNFRIFL